MKAAYLLVDLSAVAFPMAFGFSSRYGFGADWKKAWAAVAISAIPFLAWDMAFTRAGVWGFNSRYLLGAGFFNLPFEEALFFLCIPFSCLFIYRQFRFRPFHGAGGVPDDPGSARSAAGRQAPDLALPRDPLATGIWSVLAFGLFLMAVANHGRPYTFAAAAAGSLAGALLAAVAPWYGRALMAALAVQYVPFLIVNGILTALPVVVYRQDAILGLRLGSIPVEDIVYAFVLLVLPVALFEFLTSRRARAFRIAGRRAMRAPQNAMIL
jgi:lycopene cyclase domain-containing protein